MTARNCVCVALRIGVKPEYRPENLASEGRADGAPSTTSRDIEEPPRQHDRFACTHPGRLNLSDRQVAGERSVE